MAKDDGAKPAKKSCFVISRIGDDGSDIRQAADDFLKYIVNECSAIKDGYEVSRADKMPEPGRISVQIIRAINDADLVIADVTGANPNVYYEMALRHAIGKPIVVCAEDGTRLPFDTRDNRTVFYSLHSRRAEQARGELDTQIRAIEKEGFAPDNPIVAAIDIVKLAGTGKDALAQILEGQGELAGRITAIENQLRNPFAAPTVGGLPIGGKGGGRTISIKELQPFLGDHTANYVAGLNKLFEDGPANDPTKTG